MPLPFPAAAWQPTNSLRPAGRAGARQPCCCVPVYALGSAACIAIGLAKGSLDKKSESAQHKTAQSLCAALRWTHACCAGAAWAVCETVTNRWKWRRQAKRCSNHTHVSELQLQCCCAIASLTPKVGLSPAPSSPLGGMFLLLLVSVLGVALCARASVGGSPPASAAAQRLSVALTQLARQLYHRGGTATARDRHARHGLSYWVSVLSSAVWGPSSSDTAKRRVSDVPLDVGPAPLGSDADAAERGSMLRLPHSQPHLGKTSLGPDASAAAATRRSMDALEAELAQLSPTSMARMSSSAHLSAMDASAKAAPRGRSSESAAATVCITPRGSVTVMPGAWSHIVKETSDVEWLCSILPPLQRSLPWRCLYACRRDGTSLASLLRASNGTSGPALLLVEDTNGAVFGCVTSDSWCVHAAGKRSYGTGECCVFTMRPYKHCWTWERQGPRVFQVASNEALSLGGAPHFALWLDAELRYGSSGNCSTFGSPCLASSPEFEIASVELYHFGSDGAAIAHRRDSAASLDESRRALEG